jgi:hypothetical protein
MATSVKIELKTQNSAELLPSDIYVQQYADWQECIL